MYVVLTQRGTHNDEAIKWFSSETHALLYASNMKDVYFAHWGVILRYWPATTAGFQQIREWGTRT